MVRPARDPRDERADRCTDHRGKRVGRDQVGRSRPTGGTVVQLTPRSLVMAGAAMLVGGVAFGVITTFTPRPSVAGSSPSSSPSATWSDVELGDRVSTYATGSPTPTSSPTPSASTSTASQPASPLPSASTPASGTTQTPAAEPSATRPSAPAHATPRPTPTATPRATTAPQPIPTATHRPNPLPARHTAKPVEVRRGWSAPTIQVGVNDLRPPSLNSGAVVHVTVACSPSRACIVSGSDLVIDPAASSVTVTWSAPARAGYRAWSVARAL